MFLAISTNTGDVGPLAEAEFDRLDDLRAVGTVVDCWVKGDQSGAVVLLDCVDDLAARSVLESFPSVSSGLTTFEVLEIVGLDSVRPGSA